MPEGLKIRGSVLKGYGKYVKKMWGQTGMDECCKAINFDGNTLIQGQWYDANLITKMFEWMSTTHGREYVERAGNYAVKDLGILSYLLRFASIETLLKKASEQYKEAFSWGEVEIHVQGKTAVVMMKDIAISEFACVSWLGGIKGMLELTKTNGTVKETQCQWKGAPHCEFKLEWS
jgi:predicted hydrocarbon binding protein